MGVRDETKKIIAQFTGHENVIAVPIVLINFTGDRALAMMLNQLLYWSDKSEWIYKSLNDWCKEIGHISRRTMNSFGELPYIETSVRKANGVPTTHYRLNYEMFITKLLEYIEQEEEFEENDECNCTDGQLEVPNCAVPFAQMGKTLTEITTETTTETTTLTGTETTSLPAVVLPKTNIEQIYEPCDDDGLPLAEKKKKKEKAEVKSPEIFRIAEALSEVTGMPMSLHKGRLFREAKLLMGDERVSAELIRQLYSPGGAWYQQDWRGKKGQKPRISEVRETIFVIGEVRQKIIRGDIKNPYGESIKVIRGDIKNPNYHVRSR